MKKKISTLCLLGFGFASYAQNVGIGTSTPTASAKLEISSTSSGLLIPRVSLVAVSNGTTPVASPATGVLVFNTNASVTGGSGQGFYYWDGSTWRKLASGGAGSNDIVSGTSALTVTNGTGQVMGGSNVTLSVANNSSTSAGLVTSGTGQNTMVWGTDATGNPSWRSPFSMLTRYDVSSPTTGVTISNGTGQVVGGSNMTISVATNSSTSPGLVTSGAGQNTMVWGTDAAGNPTWRSPFSMLTRYDVSSPTTGVTITNGTGQVVGGSNMSISVATNSSTSPGLVTSGAGQNTMVWGTDAAGNPTWRTPNTMLTRNDVTSPTTGVTITNGTGQIVGGSNMSISVATNSSTSPGLVTSGAGQNTMVWGTDAAGNPTWRSPNSMITKNDITTSTTGVTITNGTGQVVGGSNVAVNVATNSSTSPGLVTSGAGQVTRVWGTDAAGNPGWVEAGTLIDVQNGLNINTTAPNASATNPFVELGGTLIRNTTITQGAFNMTYDLTGAGLFRINHVNTTAATATTYPFGVNRAGTTEYTVGSDGSFVYEQSWNSKPLLINGQGNFVAINKTTAPIQNLDVNGRMNVANGVIQRGTTQINVTSDLGLYSQVAGNWIRVAANGAPVKFFVDQGGGNSAGTNALMSVDNANGGGVMIAAETSGLGNAGSPNNRAALELSSTTKGMLTTRLTTAQRDAMGTGLAEGLLIYNTDNNCFEFWDTKSNPTGGGGFWNSLCKWCENVVIVNSSASGFNLNSFLGGAKAQHYCVYVQAGVTLSASGPSGSGFNATTMPAGSSITLYNYGNILAGGGNGGTGGTEVDGVCSGSDTPGATGGPGGHAVQTSINVPIVCYNYGTLRAGGGGGGGGGYGCCSAGGGGGGGAGTPAGNGGGGNTSNCVSGFTCGCNSTSSAGGNAGTALVGGTGVAGANRPATGCPTCNGRNAGTGGNGGNPGIGGTAGSAPEGNGTGGNGGAAGLAIQGAGSGSSLAFNAGTVTGGVNP